MHWIRVIGTLVVVVFRSLFFHKKMASEEEEGLRRMTE